ncbi:MAG: DNA repair protein RecO [Alphaproteobacteria bacterium]
MQWADEGIVLSSRRHGENGAVLMLLTVEHGRHAGLVRGATGGRLRGALQPGNEVRATWRARLADHLGSYAIEPGHGRAGLVMADRTRLAGLSAVCAVAEAALPEREPHPVLHAATQALLGAIEAGLTDWPAAYVRWELGLLQDLGFGLDLSRCVATGTTEDLVYVSPKSARAVSRDGGSAYVDKLLPLPGFLLGQQGGPTDTPAVADGLRLTGFFLERSLLAHREHMPAARARLVEVLRS